MKKLILLLILSALVVLFTGCRGESLGFMSILDTELGEVFTLGDTMESIGEILGEPERVEELIEGRLRHRYQNGLSVAYVDGKAVSFFAASALEESRFEILGYRIGMTEEQVADNFMFDEVWSYDEDERRASDFRLYYDEYGNFVDAYYAHVFASVVLTYGLLGERINISLVFITNQ